ncbi:MAG: type 4a pilus biogenesis protein PilO [Candidatus Levybacteria bacterium]|nr:type 4a pilus biogenesis protein PilO [Candidatus Levybacteria bacterium]
MKITPELLSKLSKERYLKYIRSLPNIHEEKVQTYATLILTITACMFFGIFAISPTLSTISELKKTLEDNKYLDKQLQTKIANMTLLDQAYQPLSSQLPILYKAVPTSAELTKLAGQLRTIASTNNVTLTQLQTQSVELATHKKMSSTLQEIPIALTIQGKLSDMESFYEDIVNIERIITITSLTLTVPADQKSGELKLIIQASAYYQP